MPLKRYFTEYKSEYDKNDNSKNQLSKLSVQCIAQKRDLLALLGPVIATLIKRTRAELLITQPCHVN
ncbi:hypothetical protein T11_11023 [Trichinella zimbabwensis]|uniref:Uncharacterized protein n=1 Tax=Trichinella zimbabwensis TaxID=268475 RepID=A0A0V1GG03_9BILA|nr:hypothetical protein T11_11023 [Trichinella zimbabwensis]